MIINGEEYIKKSDVKNISFSDDENGLPCVMVRTYSAGVHFGYMKNKKGKEVELINSRRVYYWSGAASLSELAIYGSSNKDDCKIPCIVPRLILTEAIEIIDITDQAKENLYSIKEWKIKE